MICILQTVLWTVRLDVTPPGPVNAISAIQVLKPLRPVRAHVSASLFLIHINSGIAFELYP